MLALICINFEQAAVENKYSKLQDLTNQRRAKLNDSKKLFEFYREANEVSTWITEKGNVASSEDYGTDLEHVEVIIHLLYFTSSSWLNNTSGSNPAHD